MKSGGHERAVSVIAEQADRPDRILQCLSLRFAVGAIRCVSHRRCAAGQHGA